MDAVAREHGARLAALRGRRLSRSWVVWDRESDRWFNDAPIVLEFEGERLDFCATRSDEVAISWNGIDVSRQPGWFGLTDALDWRGDGLAALACHRGGLVLDARVSRDPNGCAFTLESGELRIFNAVDEVGVSAAPAGGR